MNRPKAKGTAAETAVVRHAREHGFPGAERQPLHGALDQGDLTLCPSVIAEIKAHKTAGTGQPGPKVLATWMDQTELERVNAGAEFALLIVKRTGSTDVATFWCYLPMWQVAALLGMRDYDRFGHVDPNDVVCLTVRSAFALLLAAGYGDACAVAGRAS